MTSLYYAVHKCVFKGRGYTTEYFHAFKDNFRQATFSWVIFLVLFAILTGDIYIMRNYISPDSPLAGGSMFFVVLLLLTIVWMIYHMAYIARFANTFKASFKVSAVIMIANLGWSVLILLIVTVIFLAVNRLLILLVFVPAIISGVLHPILEKVFRKYMSPEDLAKEDEI